MAAARTRLAIASSHFRPPAGNAGAYKGSLSTLQVDGAYTSEAPPFLLQLEGTRYEMGYDYGLLFGIQGVSCDAHAALCPRGPARRAPWRRSRDTSCLLHIISRPGSCA
ncbi:unnamed protein product [Symbiodinium sp. KB8]|nr:unnamed protein product [Symbiodinium sp. KB8]